MIDDDKTKQQEEIETVKQVSREEWIARAVAAAAINPGKRAPANTTKPITNKD